MECARILAGRVNPGLEHFKHKEVVAVHQPRIDHAAFQVGVALGDQWRVDQRSRRRRQAKGFELVHTSAGCIAATHHRRFQFHGRDVEHALPRRLQGIEAEISTADDAAHQRRLELHHGVPRHRHHVGTAFVRRGQQHNRSGLKKAVDLGQGTGTFGHAASLGEGLGQDWNIKRLHEWQLVWAQKKTPKGLFRKATVSPKNIISWQQALQLSLALHL